MSKISQAAQFFDCKEDELKEFDVEDTFNPPNSLRGYICRISDHRYGALYITNVNHIPCAPQIVWGTPKQHYPFGKDGRFVWPPIKKINIYNKLDGTNILAYSYSFRKKKYVTYKTRLGPVARSGQWGDFPSMWREMLDKYPSIPKTVLDLNLNLSFELYGARNLHLIVYNVPLDAKFLFATPQTLAPGIIDPEKIDLPEGMPPVVAGEKCTALNDLTSFYKKRQAETEAMNKTVEMGIKGSEGFVLYAHLEDGNIRQFKCKPETIQQIHWTHGGLGKNVIKATIINAFENEDNVTITFVKELLREEFEPAKIERQSVTIAKILDEVKLGMAFRAKVVNVYKEIGISVAEDKIAAMRALSERFERRKMGYVYWIVTNCC